MKRCTAILLVALALFVLFACNKQQTGRETIKEETTFTTTTTTATISEATPLRSTSTIEATSIFSSQISEDGKQLLQQYGEYAAHGVVINMKLNDVVTILGPLEKKQSDYGSWRYTYRNMVIDIDPNHPTAKDRVYYIDIVHGSYMGLTIGESTKEDAEKQFRKHANDDFEERPDGSGYSRFYVVDGIYIIVGYQDKIINTIRIASDGDY